MHEMGFCEALLAAARRRAAGRPVRRLRVQVGVLHRISPEAFQQSFTMLAGGTEAENAEVELVSVPVRSICRRCRYETDCDELPLACAACGSVDIQITGGEEVILESLEYDPTLSFSVLQDRPALSSPKR